MQTKNNPLLVTISEAFAKGDLAFAGAYLADNIIWNILGEEPINGKPQVLEISKMSQLQSYPVITITNIIAAGNFVVIESEGEAKTKTGETYNQRYCEIFKFENEQLQEITTYLDTALSGKAAN